jgi:hypothetical protein
MFINCQQRPKCSPWITDVIFWGSRPGLIPLAMFALSSRYTLCVLSTWVPHWLGPQHYGVRGRHRDGGQLLTPECVQALNQELCLTSVGAWRRSETVLWSFNLPMLKCLHALSPLLRTTLESRFWKTVSDASQVLLMTIFKSLSPKTTKGYYYRLNVPYLKHLGPKVFQIWFF